MHELVGQHHCLDWIGVIGHFEDSSRQSRMEDDFATSRLAGSQTGSTPGRIINSVLVVLVKCRPTDDFNVNMSYIRLWGCLLVMTCALLITAVLLLCIAKLLVLNYIDYECTSDNLCSRLSYSQLFSYTHCRTTYLPPVPCLLCRQDKHENRGET